jgi:hypothetical protein
MYNLGCCYSEGMGVAQDDSKAARWYAEAAVSPFLGRFLRTGIKQFDVMMYTRMSIFTILCHNALLQSRGFTPTLEDEKVYPRLITNEVKNCCKLCEST